MKERFSNKKIRDDKRVLISLANEILTEYQKKGFVLTLRQVYYQFVARDLFTDRYKNVDGKWIFVPKDDPEWKQATINAQPNYKKLGDAVSDGRMLGLLDWEALEDRMRGVERLPHWKSPKSAIEAVRAEYYIDMWANQPARVQVWVEKDALSGIIEPVCNELDLPYLACRGYVSQSAAWRAYREYQKAFEAGQKTIVLHFGDHDPSGIDMTRDNDERLKWFMFIAQMRNTEPDSIERNELRMHGAQGIEVRRLALSWDQIQEYNPPPNFAKEHDPRFKDYQKEFGDESWELDALDPEVIEELIRTEVDEIRDMDLWAEKEAQLAKERKTLDNIIKGLP